MTEQQYTCPSCHKDYTRFTIADHYGCGVEPLEMVENIKQRKIESVKVDLSKPSTDIGLNDGVELVFVDGELKELAISEQPAPESAPEIVKPEPKKRGRKPKVKV